METLVELQARYDALLLSNPATAAAAGAPDTAVARVAELEAALQEKEARLKAAEVGLWIVDGVVGAYTSHRSIPT